MGTTLTGKRVQNTYDSLLKLSDNDNLTGTAKVVGDGLGNDSPIYLSTSQVGIGVTPSYQFQTSGNAKIGANLIVGGNLTVNGSTTIVDSTIVAIGDNMIEMAKDNVSNTMDIGWYGTIVESGTKYVGTYYDAGSGVTTPTFYIGLGTTEPSSTAAWTVKGKLVIGDLSANGGDFTDTVYIDDHLEIENSSGYGYIELGGSSGGYIDLKGPFSNDFDLRVFTDGTNSQINAIAGSLDITANSGIDLQYQGSNKLTVISTGIDITGNLFVSGGFKDSDEELGTSGQVLSSTGTGTNWVDFDADSAKALEIDVKNVFGATMTKGTVVHAEPTGTLSGNVIEVVKADANVAANMPAIGVLNEDLNDDEEGKAVMFGTVQGIDTSSFSVGDELYVSTTAGSFTATKPTATTEQVQKIAVVVKSHASNGLIKVFGAGRANDVPNLIERSVAFDGGNLSFGNDDKIFFGDNQDFNIQSNGVNTFLSNLNNNLVIQNSADDLDIIFRADNGDGTTVSNYLVIDGSTGGVNLYHYGTKKFETTSTGIDVTGDISTSGDIELTGANKYIYLRTGTNSGLWQEDNFSLRFGTNNIEALELDNSQNATFAGDIYGNLIELQGYGFKGGEGDILDSSTFGKSGIGNTFRWVEQNSTSTGSTWRKVCDVTLNTSFFDGVQMEVVVYQPNTNWGDSASFIKNYYSVAFRGSQSDVGPFYEDAIVYGINADLLRVYKVSTNNYELQARSSDDNRDLVVEYTITSKNNAKVTPNNSYTAGTTSGGTAYTASANSNTKTKFAGEVEFQGTTIGDDLRVNGILYLGAGADTTYGGYLTNKGAANEGISMKVQDNDGFEIYQVWGNAGESSLSFEAVDEAVKLYYAGSEKLKTTTNGIEVTGTGIFSSDITVNGGDIILGGTGRIQGVDTVSAGTDAANKDYVDNQVSDKVDGSGTANYIPKWSDNNTLTNSNLYDNGSITQCFDSFGVYKTDPVIILSDTDATNTTNQTGYISYQINGTESGWIGFGSSGTSDFTMRNTNGAVVLDSSNYIETKQYLNINNVGSDRKIEFNRTGGNQFSIEHDSSQIYFYNASTGKSNLLIENGGQVFINPGLINNNGLKVYWDIKVYNTLFFTNSSFTTQGYISGGNGALTFNANGSLVAYMNESQRMGIGTSTDIHSLLTLSGDTNSYTTAPIISFNSTSTASANVRNWAIGPADSDYGNFHIFKSSARGESAISTAESVMVIDYNGKVGIGVGTYTVSEKLDVHGNAYLVGVGSSLLFDTTGANGSNGIKTINDYETVIYNGRGAAGFGVFGNSNIRLGFGTNYYAAETDLIITSAGKVGIGLTNPNSFYADQLVVNEGMTLYGTGNSFLCFADGTSGDDRRRGEIRYEHSSDSMVFMTNANNRMVIDTNGNVRVGGGSHYTGTGITSLTVNNDLYPTFALGSTTANRYAMIAYSSAIHSYSTSAPFLYSIAGTERVRFCNVNMTGGWDETLRISNQFPVLSFKSDAGPGYYAGLAYDGGYGLRFYLGASSTDIPLTGTHAGFADTAGRWVLGAGSTSTISSAALTIAGVNGSYGAIAKFNSGGNIFQVGAVSTSTTTNFELWNTANGYIRFATNNDEKMMLNALGHLDINDTSYNASDGRTLQVVNSTASVLAHVAYDTVLIQQNDAPTLRIYESGDDIATTISSDVNNSTIATTDNLRFYTNGSSTQTAYNGLVGTHVMTMDTSGRVLIKQTSSLTSGLLQVNGYIDITEQERAFRTMNGSTFVGGMGDGKWAFGGTSYTSDLSFYAQNNLLLHAGTGSTIDLFIQGSSHRIGSSDDGTVFTPSTRLHLKDVSDAQLTLEGRAATWAGIFWKDAYGSAYTWFYGSTQTWAFGGGGSAVSGKRIHCDGGMTIGSGYDSVTMPTNGLWVQGTIKCADDLVAFDSSDKRLKDDIRKIEKPLDKLDKINGYKFKWNTKQDIHEGEDYGVIAQEIQEVMPEIVNLKESGYYGVKYDKLIPLLIESVKELSAKVQELESRKCNCNCK